MDNSIWFGRTLGRIWRSVNFGKDWTAHVADPGGKFVNEIAFNDDKLHGVAHLRDNQSATYLYATTDGGINWTAVGQPAYWKRSRITAVPGTNALVSTSVVGSDPGSALSYDNGTTWTIIDNTIYMAVSRFYNATTGYAGSFFLTGPPLRPGIYKSQINFEPVSIKTIPEAQGIKIYPTPASDVINIELTGRTAKTTSLIQLMDIDGKVVATKNSGATDLIQIDISKLIPGLYLLRIIHDNKTISKTITISR